MQGIHRLCVFSGKWSVLVRHLGATSVRLVWGGTRCGSSCRSLLPVLCLQASLSTLFEHILGEGISLRRISVSFITIT